MGIQRGLNPRFAEMGKIKIGGKGKELKSKAGNNYRQPIKFEHFVVTTTEKDKETDNFIIDENIMKILGDKPKEIAITLPFDDIDMNFFTSFQYYAGKKCICQGDGLTAIRTDKNDNKSQVDCNPEKCEHLLDNKCKVSGILSCHIKASMEIGGVYRFRTHSWNSVSNILVALKYFSDNTNGILQGLPLKLKFLKKSTAEHGNVNVVTIVIDGVEMLELRNKALEESKDRARLGIDMKLLENQATNEGFLDDKDDPEDVHDEFYNENPEPVEGISADETLEKMSEPDKPVADKPEPGALL